MTSTDHQTGTKLLGSWLVFQAPSRLQPVELDLNLIVSLSLSLRCQGDAAQARLRGRGHAEHLGDQQVPRGAGAGAGRPPPQGRGAALHLLLRGQRLHTLHPGQDATRSVGRAQPPPFP